MVVTFYAPLTIVLFCLKENIWKIADFGITAIFTSKSARTTKYARGSENYLPPELLSEPAIVTKKVDIWGLGCIFYELATGKAAFRGYGSIREYALSRCDFVIPNLPYEKSDGIFIADTIHNFLTINPTERPDATTAYFSLRLPGLPSAYEREHEWMTDGDKKLICVAQRGKGSSGEVFEVRDSSF